MSASLRLSVANLNEERASADFYGPAQTAALEDGYDPFNEQTRLDIASEHRTPLLITEGDPRRVIGSAVIGAGELDLVISPIWRGARRGDVALTRLLHDVTGTLTAWSHGDHPAARALAARHGFARVRTLLQLRLDLNNHTAPKTSAQPGLHGSDTIEPFQPEADEEAWVALNAKIFASHPEQGSITHGDLRSRQNEAWFRAADFLVMRNASGTMIGYNWLKIEPGSNHGEIYVIGVDADAAGKGRGRALMTAGLARLLDRGCSHATLYVEADNTRAVNLYRSLGFNDHTVDVQYRRPITSSQSQPEVT